METEGKTVKELQEELAQLKDTLTKYGTMFYEDGHIDEKEQASFERISLIIKDVEDKLAAMNA